MITVCLKIWLTLSLSYGHVWPLYATVARIMVIDQLILRVFSDKPQKFKPIIRSQIIPVDGDYIIYTI